MNELTLCIIALSTFKGIGERTILRVLRSAHATNDYLSYQYLTSTKLDNGNNPLARFLEKDLTPENWVSAKKEAHRIVEETLAQDIAILNYQDSDYPDNLKVLDNKPLILYVKGNVSSLNDRQTVAVIGTREPTSFAEAMGRRMTEQLVDDGFTIVSGLALGCDSIAHQAAVDKGGKTIAVLAHGLDQPVYPKENAALAEQILQTGGALVSTYPIGTKMSPWALVARDEWQSGLSNGVIAIETSEDGGTIHAMTHAGKQQRPLGVLDHTLHQAFDHETYADNIQGNQNFLKDGRAIGIYELESLKAFEDQLMDTKRVIDQIIYEADQPKLQTDQTSLF